MKLLGHLAAALLLTSASTLGLNAWASGGDVEDEFVSRSATDIELKRYASGELGVILPSYPRVYLYPAWRAIVLGTEGLKKHPTSPEGLKQALGTHVSGWVDPDTHPYNRWHRESSPLLQRPALPSPPVFRTVSKSTSQYLNCPAAAFEFALQNLATLRKRLDATPERLRDWVAAQDRVFDFCVDEPRTQPQDAQDVLRPKQDIPEPLAATEPRYWRQMRDYQIASAHFYNESYALSRAGFDAIAATHDHPLQSWGAYLALRSQLRSLSMQAKSNWISQPKLLEL